MGFGDELLALELDRKEGEEDLTLVERFDCGQRDLLGAMDELVGLSHVEDELVADKLGGGIIIVGADQFLEPDVSST